MYGKIKEYSLINDIRLIREIDEATIVLNKWMLKQRRDRRQKKLSELEVQKLDGIGFVWAYASSSVGNTKTYLPKPKSTEKPWNEYYEALVDFYQKQGHCKVPDSWPAMADLPRWIPKQRRLKRSELLDVDRAQKLELLGFNWTAHDDAWDLMFLNLLEHQSAMNNGKTRGDSVGGDLRRWMLTQRQARKNGKLSKEREKQLESINFEWDPFEAQWADMLTQLKEYRQIHGNCLVPSKWSEDTRLTSWVHTPRLSKRKNKLSETRISQLDEIDFCWSVNQVEIRESSWDEIYNELVEFHDACGNCNIPEGWKTPLRAWIVKQRKLWRQDKLSEDELKRLKVLGFDSHSNDLGWNQLFVRYAQLLRSNETDISNDRTKYGYCYVPTT